MKFKKVAITGHKSGIGKRFYEHFDRIVPTLGFDIIDGYNIATKYDEIIDKTKDCDLFINNACGEGNFSQSKLAEKWFQINNKNKFFILNVGSIVTKIDMKFSLPLKMYYDSKKRLEEIHYKINFSGSFCKSIIVSPGIVDTEKVKKFDNKTLEVYNHLSSVDGLMNVDDVLNATLLNLQLITEKHFISYIEVINTKMHL